MELFALVEVVLKLPFVLTQRRDCIVIVQDSQYRDLFVSANFYSGGGFEKANHSVIILGEETLYGHHWGDSTFDAGSYHGLEMYVFVCNLTKYLY